MAKDRANDPNRKVHPAGIMIVNTSGTPEAYTERIVGPRQGQKHAPDNYKTVREPYKKPVRGADIAAAKKEAKLLDEMFGGK